MAITILDSTPALVVIDLQKGIVGAATVHPADVVVARAAKLARAFRERRLPVVLVNVAGRPPGRTEASGPKLTPTADWAEIVPELQPQASDRKLTKKCPGAFLGTLLDDYLKSRGVTQVVLAGIATSVGVESTARNAFDLGYNVLLVTDAMTDRDLDSHRHSIEKVFPRLGERATTLEVLNLLNDRVHEGDHT